MKKFILFILAIIPVLGMNAQENTSSGEKAAINTTFEASRFRDNWFISLDGGVSELMSEETRYLKFGDRISPTVALSVGKWLSPVWGLRLNVTGSQLNGFATWENNLGLGDWYLGANHPYPGQGKTNTYLNVYDDPAKAQFVKDRFLGDPRSTSSGNGYDYDLKYMGGSVDFLWNINNTFRPYNPKRVFEVVLFAGLAYAHTFKESSPVDGYDRTAVNTVGVKGGAQFKFRLSDAWDFHLEGQTYILPEMFDRRVGDGNTMDAVTSYLAGFTYKIPVRNFKKFECPPVVDSRPIVPVAPVVKNDQCCDELRARLQRIEELLNKKEPAAAVKENLKIVVYFVIDKHQVRETEMYKLDEIARFMNKYPDTKVSISGYADKKTAYPEYNMKLSERRANEVVRLLSTKYGISKDRLSIKAFGDSVQPFDANELNRAVIAINIE